MGSATTAPTTTSQGKKGQSLWSDAWRRLRKNKAAMVGLVIVVLVALSAVFAGLLTPFQADYGQPWLQAQPPGFTHPAVLAEIRFDVGQPAEVPEDVPHRCADIMTSDGVLTYTAREIEETLYRVKLRRGKIDQIKRMEGAKTVKVLEVAGDQAFLQARDRPDAPKLQNVALKRRGTLPEGLETKERILMVTVVQPRTPEAETIEVEIREGDVTAIRRGIEELADVESLRLQGRYVSQVLKDGVEQRLHHPLGTDRAGRDMLARVIYGGRISMMVGAIATIVSVIIGVIYGALAGYLAHSRMTVMHIVLLAVGLVASVAIALLVAQALSSAFAPDVDPAAPEVKTDASNAPALIALFVAVLLMGLIPFLGGRWIGEGPGPLGRHVTTKGEFMMRVVDILNALPFMFLVILLMVSFGRDIFTLFFALGAVQWLTIARIVRGQVLSLKEKEFVEAAEMCGTGHMGIVFGHLIPNTLGVVIVYATLTVPAVILQESFLAFIGLNVEFQGRALDSWGSLVNIGRQSLTSDGGNWWVLIFPSAAMAITLFSLNFLGDGLRDALDPKLKGKS